MKLYFARHGDTDANEHTLPDPTFGVVNESLNSLGVQQATKLAEELKDITFDAIISSPLKRALETAEIVARPHNQSIIVEDDLQERKITSHVSLEVWEDLFDFDKNIQIENSENLTDFFKRIYDAIEKLERKYSDKTILLVAHGGVHSALYIYANNLPLVGNLRVSNLKNCEYRIYEINTKS